MAAIILTSITMFNALLWWDKGSGGTHDGSFWSPSMPPQFQSLGSLGTRGYNSAVIPGSQFFAARPGTDPDALTHPVGYNLIWADRGSGANLDGSIWSPIPRPGYSCLGHVAQFGYDAPSVLDVSCVKTEYTVAARAGTFVWNDENTGSVTDFGAWLLEDRPDQEFGFPVGTFYGDTSQVQPPARQDMRVLKFSSVSFVWLAVLVTLYRQLQTRGNMWMPHTTNPLHRIK